MRSLLVTVGCRYPCTLTAAQISLQPVLFYAHVVFFQFTNWIIFRRGERVDLSMDNLNWSMQMSAYTKHISAHAEYL